MMIKKILILIISVFSISLIIEFSLRIYGLGNPIVYEKSLYWGYSPKPNQTTSRFKNSKITINEYGVRSKKIEKKFFDFLFFGDSVTYGGSYIDDDETFSSIVCNNLNRSRNKKDLTCGNAGVNAYGIKNIIPRINYLKDKYPNNKIIITVITGNFLRNFSQIESLPYFTKRNDYLFKASVELIAFSLDLVRKSIRYKSNNFFSGKYAVYNKYEFIDAADTLQSYYYKNIKNNNILIIWSPSLNNFENGLSDLDKELIDKLDIFKDDFVNMYNEINSRNINYKKIFYDQIHLNKYGHQIYGKIIADKFK